MAPRISFLLLFCVLTLTARAGEVFRWVDENGKVHYGDAIPEKYKQQAKKVDSSGGVTDAQRQEAESRTARERARAESLQKARESKAGTPQPAAPTPADVPKAGDECEEQLRKYLESQDCFAPYVNATGGIKPEAFQHCTEVKQPKGCFPKSGPSERIYLPGAP
ncbi:MAG TPA: DUF4124 domain-containing protein [Burkholderiales bacterium]|jgi:hypothetical protein|nr:DUF4124 domain-containing protein [Burkholderiales bacterium]